MSPSLPAVLLEHGPFGATYWQLLLVPLMYLAAYVLARLLCNGLSFITIRTARLTKVRWDELLVKRLRGPGALLLTGVSCLALPQVLELPPRLLAKVISLDHMLILVSGFWGLLRVVDIVHATAKSGQWIAQRPTAVPVLGLLVRVAKITIVALATVTALQQLGYPVAAILTGLGVGGLAVALAAQKTLENLLGSVMLSIDQPLRVGDLVQVEGVLGTVEEIGLRSTRVRTSARTLVSIPNGKLADSRIENMQSRDRLQLNVVLNVEYKTKIDTVQEIIVESRKLIALHPKTFKPDCAVHLVNLGENAYQIEVNTCIVPEPKDDFREIRQELFFALVRIIESKGAALAYPTRTVFLEK